MKKYVVKSGRSSVVSFVSFFLLFFSIGLLIFRQLKLPKEVKAIVGTLNIAAPTGTVSTSGFTLGGVNVTTSGTELNYVSGVKQAIQPWIDTTTTNISTINTNISAAIGNIDLKANIASPSFTGNITMPGTGYWNSSGNVGIGTTSPGAKLDIQGGTIRVGPAAGIDSIAVYGNIAIEGAAGVMKFFPDSLYSAGGAALTYWNGSAVTTALKWTNTGNVGIGTTAPGSTLTVKGTSGNIFQIINSAGNTAFTIDNAQLQSQFYANANLANPGITFNGDTDTGINHPLTNNLNFITNSLERVRIDASGNVGIGTTGPDSQLQTTGKAHLSNVFVGGPPAGGTPDYSIYSDSVVGNGNLHLSSRSGGNLFLNTLSGSGNVIMLPVGGGNVGIGTTAPGYKLDVQGGAINTSGGLYWNGQSLDSRYMGITSGTTNYVTKFTGATTIGNSSIYDNGANVGIGTTAPAAQLDVPLSNEMVRLGTSGVASGLSLTSGSLLSQASQFQIVGMSTVPISFYTGGTYGSMTAGTEKMRLSSAGGLSLGNSYVGTDPGAGAMIVSGNVGIGTTAPGGMLDVNGTFRATAITGNRMGDSTDTLRGLSILNSSLSVAAVNWLTLGVAASANNQAEIGFYYAGAGSAANRMVLGLYGTQVMNLLGNGNVGIGTTAPGYKLDVQGGAINTSGGLYWNGQSLDSRYMGITSGTTNYVTKFTGATTIGNSTIFDNGNVGIGTTNPYSTFTALGSFNAPSLTHGTASAVTLGTLGGYVMSMGQNGASPWNYYMQVKHDGADVSGTLAINPLGGTVGIGYPQPGATAALAINGNVGIGTTGPGDKLDVYGGIRATNAGSTGYYTYQKANWAQEDSFELGISGHKLITSGNYMYGTELRFWSNDVRRMTIDGNGNVGIGTTAPGQKLDVQGGAVNASSGFYWNGTSLDSRYMGITSGTTNYVTKFTGATTIGNSTIYDNGNVGIGTTAPGSALAIGDGYLTINRTADPTILMKQNGTAFGQFRGNGTILGITDAGGATYDLAVNTTNGNVGIGTTSPGTKLDVAGGVKTSGQLTSTLATGTSPFAVTSTTVNTNLNADFLDGYQYNNLPYLTANQTITLTGDVTGSGTTSIATTIAANVITAADLAAGDFSSKINSGTYSINISGNATTATRATYVYSPDGNRPLTGILPTTNGNAVRYDFANAGAAGTGGNYAGVMTYAPWTGTTASTGDASYQLAFGSTAANGGGIPQLNIRKGIDSTWNSWYTILHSGNYNSYAPTLTGGGASGNWAINAATATNVAYSGLTGTVPTWNQNTTGNAATATNVAWTGVTGKPIGLVNMPDTGQAASSAWSLAWKNYTNHMIVDMSAGTAPNGTAHNNTNPEVNWGGTYPTLMGWNGTSTYGVRVDVARYADSAGQATNATNVNGGTVSATTGNFSGTVTAPTFVSSNAGTTNSIYTTSPSGNATLTIQGGNYTHAIYFKDSYNTSAYATLSGGYLNEAALSLNTYSAQNTISNTSTYGASHASIAGSVTATQFNGAGTGLTGTAAGLNIGGNAGSVDNQSFTWLNSSNSPAYVWGVDTNGVSSYLAARASMSVNYATHAAYTDTIGLYYQGGNVGIGTTAPLSTFKLDVRYDGTGTAWQRMGLSNSTGDKTTFLGTYNSNAVVGAHNFAISAWAPLYVNSVNGTDGGNVLIGGSVGIGTTAPAVKLDVVGTVDATLFTGPLTGNATSATNFNNGTSYSSGGNVYATTFNGALSGNATTATSLSGNSGKTGKESRLYRSDSETSYGYYIKHSWTANSNGWRITASNDVADEQANIHRVSVDQADYAVSAGTATDSTKVAKTGDTMSGALTANGGINFPGSGIWNTSGNVGIGTAGPGSKLHIYQPTPDTDALIIQTTTINSDGAQHYGAISFQDYAGKTGNYSQIRNYSNLYSSWGSQLAFYVTTGGSPTLSEAMRINSSGNVGIGTTAPAVKLDVVGTVDATLFTGPLTGNVTGNVSGSAGSVLWTGVGSKPTSITRIQDTTGSYGSMNIAGTTSGYAGFNFIDEAVTFMVDGTGATGMYNNSGSWQWYFTSAGVLTAGTVPWGRVTGAPAFLTANQTITLTGDVTGSGTTSIATAIAANVVTAADLAAGDFSSKINSGTYSINISGTATTATTATNLAAGGNFNGTIACIAGFCPTNSAIRSTPNLHLNTPVGYAMIVNWDNGATGGTVQQFRVGNGSAADAFYVRADGGVYGGIFNGSGAGLSANTVPWGSITGEPTSYPASDVYAWAKAATKPSYAFSEIGGAVTDAQVPDNITITQATNATNVNGGTVNATTGNFSGNVGIGTNAPQSQLSVGGQGQANTAISGTGYFGVYGSGTYGIYGSGTTSGVYGSGTTYGVYGSGGTYGVYGSSSGVTTGVFGSNNGNGIGVSGSNTGTGYGIYCAAAGANKCGGNQAWYNASDRKLKENIVPINNALSKVLKLQGVTYNLKSDPSKTPQMGFIAQDVLPYVPEVVAYDKKNDYWGMQTSQLTALLVNAMQEQQTQIVSLQSITTDFIGKFKEGLIETKKLVVDGVDIAKKLTELSDKADKQQRTIEAQQKQNDAQQKQIDDLKKTVEGLKK